MHTFVTGPRNEKMGSRVYLLHGMHDSIVAEEINCQGGGLRDLHRGGWRCLRTEKVGPIPNQSHGRSAYGMKASAPTLD